nr:hypothetical protein [uncultured Sphingomonas sp.]
MDVRFIGCDDDNLTLGLCSEYEIRGARNFAELVEARRKIVDENPGVWPLLSLDDPWQASYTSMHTKMDLDLEGKRSVIAGVEGGEAFDIEEHWKRFTPKERLSFRVQRLNRLAADMGYEEACGFGLTIDDAALDRWFGFQRDPLTLLDKVVFAVVVPASTGEEAFAAFPNGYFSCDLSPPLNLAVIRHFHRTHGYDLIGMGASYLGFWRETPPDEAAAAAIANDFRLLYNVGDDAWVAMQPSLVEAIAERSHLWLRYSE